MKILYLIYEYQEYGGASTALRAQIENDCGFYSEYLVVAGEVGLCESPIRITTSSDCDTICQFIDTDEKLVVYYVKSCPSTILYDILDLFKKKPIVVIQCDQSPSYRNLWLSPFELKVAWHIVFIDKSSFNDSLIQFIPEACRSMCYSTSNYIYKEFSGIPKSDNNGKIVFGRGSSMNKCSKEMFDVFDKIDVPNKVFRIVGIPEGDNWVRREASRRNNVEVYDFQPGEKWETLCNSFDVFLYQLPTDSYASIDGTLGLAMLLKKPCVYMGSPAPKERFHHGENGYVANTIEEMAEYATLLGRDPELRNRIGERARETTIEEFRPEVSIEKYKQIYNNLDYRTAFKIPLSYKFFFCRNNDMQILTILEKRHHLLYVILIVLKRIKRFIFNHESLRGQKKST